MMEIQIPRDALVMVGDGSRALFLRNRGTSANLNLVLERQVEHDYPATRS